MIQPTTVVDIPEAEQIIIVDPQPAKTNILKKFTFTYLFQHLGHIYTLAAMSRGLGAPLRQLWTRYYLRVALEEEGVVMPHSALGFIINSLLAFVEIKAQGVPGFPFQTHPQAIMFSVTSLLLYCLASAVALVISAAAVDRYSVYAIVAHLGKIGSLYILVASLASLFYF